MTEAARSLTPYCYVLCRQNFRLFPSLLNPSPLNDLGRCPKNPLLRIDYLNRNTPYFCTIFIMLTLNRNTRGRRRKQFKTSKHRRREYNRGLRYERDGQQATRRWVAVLHRTAPATEEHVARITTKNLSSNSTRGCRREQFKEKGFQQCVYVGTSPEGLDTSETGNSRRASAGSVHIRTRPRQATSVAPYSRSI